MEVLSGIAVATTTAVVVIGALIVLGFGLLFRRRGDRALRGSGPESFESVSLRASGLLVRVDDAVREADEELGFAIAQFGADAARPFGEALSGAREQIAAAFRIRQKLDDAEPDSPREQREWTLQIVALCEQAQRSLREQNAAYTNLRHREANAANALTELNARITAATSRLARSRKTVAQLQAKYGTVTYAAIADNPDRAEKALDGARTVADAVSPTISRTGVNAVTGTLQQAVLDTREADRLLDAVDRTARDLAAAETALTALRARTRTDLAEASAERDSAPDADTGRAIIDAMAAVGAALTAHPTITDPITELERIGSAVAQLDLALASARNEAQRLEHARAAYDGTLISASSQITAVREYIGNRGGGVQARTRLAEAERQYALAQAQTDPVEALDTIRRAMTLARDADALARYDTMGL